MNPHTRTDFDQHYQTHLKHLKLKGLQPKTIDAYARTIRRMGDYFVSGWPSHIAVIEDS
jgi:integrase/recombinase XerD